MDNDIKQPENGGGLGEEKKPEASNTEPKTEQTTGGPTGPTPSTTSREGTPPSRNDDDKTVTLTRGDLRGLLDEVKDDVTKEFEGKLKDVNEELGILREASDEKRLFNVTKSKKGAIQHTVDLFVYEDRVVLGWKVNKDEVFKNPSNGVWTERQIVEIVLEADAEGNEKKVEFANYLRFDDIKRANRKKVKILGKEVLEDESGTIVYRVQHPVNKDKEIRVAAPFVN